MPAGPGVERHLETRAIGGDRRKGVGFGGERRRENAHGGLVEWGKRFPCDLGGASSFSRVASGAHAGRRGASESARVSTKGYNCSRRKRRSTRTGDRRSISPA